MVGLDNSGMFCTGRSTAKWHVDRSFKKRSKRRWYRERHEKDI